MSRQAKARQFASPALFAAAAAIPAALAWAEPPTGDDVRQLLDEVRRQREEIRTLQAEVATLRGMNDEQWLTERRAQEIRALVSDVLNDAGTRESLLQGGMTAGWDENFFMSSADGRFLLKIDGQMQFRWLFNHTNDPDRWRQGFENTRTKLTFRGHVFNPDLTYLVRMDVTRNEPELVTGLFFLQDAWVRWQMNNDWSIRAGQFKVPFNREELVSSAYQLAVERTVLNESLNLGRTQGVEMAFAGEHFRFSFVTGDGGTDNVGGFGLIEPGGKAINTNALLADVEFAVHGRGEWKLAGAWDQFSDFTSPIGEPFALMLGAAAFYQKGEHGEAAASRTEEDWWGYTVDLSAEFGGANLYAAWIEHRIETPTFDVKGYGFVVQGGVYITPKWEVFGRYEWGKLTTNLADTFFDTLSIITAGVNYYIDGHDAKLTVDVGYSMREIDSAWDTDIAGWRTDAAGSEGQYVVRVQLQLLF